MELWHCTCRLRDDREIATDPASVRAAVTRVLTKCLPRGLVIFCVVDNHAHALLASDRKTAGETMRRLELSFHWHLDLSRRFERARFKAIVDRDHLWRTVPYILRQVERHRVQTDPFWEGSALQDLLGLRWPGRALRGRLLQHLPRLRDENLHRWLGVGSDVLSQWDDELRAEQLVFLAGAAAAAFAIPTVRARGRRGQLAIRAACQAVAPEIRTFTLARTLGIPLRTAGRARVASIDVAAIRAVRRQVWLQVGWERTKQVIDPVYLVHDPDAPFRPTS